MVPDLAFQQFELFQSTPPVAGRRCNPFAGGMPGGDVFQSTPPVAGRRCSSAMLALIVPARFQSTPPVAGRRCDGRDALPFSCSTVSIHASRCREAMLARDVMARRQAGVSIHASRCREAMHLDDVQALAYISFQSTPPVAGRRCVNMKTSPGESNGFNPRLPLPGGDAMSGGGGSSVVNGFNPRLPLPGGDAPCSQDAAGEKSCFNPRLPLPGGDARQQKLSATITNVSIHASRCREAMRDSDQDTESPARFQSTPPVAGRRCFSRAW